MTIALIFLAYLTLVLAVAVGLVAIARRMCRQGDREREAAEAAEFAAWLRSEFVPQSQYQERGDR